MKNAKTINELLIYKSSEFAGKLQRTERGCRFVFDPSFLENPKSENLSSNMKKQINPIEITGVNLHPFFAGLLPEGSRLQALIKSVKTSDDDLISLFAAIGPDCIGDVYALDRNETKIVAPPKFDEIDFYKFFEKITHTSNFFKNENEK